MAEHLAWAFANVVSKHGFGVTQVWPLWLQHLTAPFVDFDGISMASGLLPSLGHPSARFPKVLSSDVMGEVLGIVVIVVGLSSLHWESTQIQSPWHQDGPFP